MNKTEAQVFGKAQSWVSDCESYYDEVHEGLQAILLTLSADCLSLNGYLTPERADFTQTVLKELDKCGYHTKEICGIIENKRLLVFETNGDHSAMVLDLQQKLNIMGASSPDYIRIAEDGVYGNETHSAMQLFFRSLLAGSAPRLTPYDTRNWPTLSRYGIGSVNRDNLNPRQLKPHVREYFNGLPDLPDQVKLPAITRDSNRTHPSKMYSFGDMQFEAGEIKPDYIIRLDTPHSLPDERIIKYHINVEDMDLINNNKIIKFLYDHLDSSKKIEAKDGKSTHILVSDEFFHFAISDKPAAWGKGFVKAVKIADRTFLLAGYALDVVCIYRAYMEDLTENGHVTYEKTGKVVVKLVSGELFAFIGGSIGAFAGSAFGPAGIIILGAAGSMLGYAFGTILAELALEITDVIMGW